MIGASTASPAAAQRVALVIGNGAYREIPALINPVRDAEAVAALLTRLGFAVDLVRDADRVAMIAAVARLARAAEGAEAAVVYYSGHGVEIGGSNALLPVSVPARANELQRAALPFVDVERQLAGRAAVTLFFLDSCRDNPFAGQAMPGGRGADLRGGAAARSIGTGLAGAASASGMLVAFATAPGRVALDGTGQANSPFTTAILHYLPTPDLEVRQMLGRVRRAVREATADRQVPWDNSSLEGEFFFASSVPTPRPPRPAAPFVAPERRAPVGTAPEVERAVPGEHFLARARGNTLELEIRESRFGGVGEPMRVFFHPDGRLFATVGRPGRQRFDTGRAWTADGAMCSQWSALRGGRAACWQIWRDGEAYGAAIDGVRVDFAIRRGDPYGLAR